MMSDDTESDRQRRANDLDREREERASNLAYKQGQREAQVDAILGAHEIRLKAINGSIDRGAAETGELRKTIDSLDDKVTELIAIQNTKSAVERALHAEVKVANEAQITQRSWRIGVLTIVLMFAGLIVSVLVAAASIAGGH